MHDNVKIVTAGEDAIASILEHIESLQRLRDEELGGRLDDLEKELSEKEKAAVAEESKLKATKDNVKQEEKKRAQINKGINSVRKRIK